MNDRPEELPSSKPVLTSLRMNSTTIGSSLSPIEKSMSFFSLDRLSEKM
jgi:hypothetical protein